VATGIDKLIGPDLGVLLITHYQRILNYITPDHVHVLMGGRIVKSGGAELAKELEEKGYEGLRAELGVTATTDEASPGGAGTEA
jgi:Fe-S cluster assembly ATP-binding protein